MRSHHTFRSKLTFGQSRNMTLVTMFVALLGFASIAFGQNFTLTVLHNNDGESQLIDAGAGLEDFGGIARFKTLVDNLRAAAAGNGSSVMLSSGDNYLAGPEFNASLGLPAGQRFFDAIGIDLIGYDALAIGNHEFDFGPDVLEQFILDVTPSEPPFLSSNLDFSAEPGLHALVNAGRIAGSTVIAVEGHEIGVVGATVPELRSISSPRDVIVGQDVAGAVQVEVDALIAAGINKIILISHLQSIAADQVLAAQLSGVDIMVAGGGGELLANSGDLLIPGDEGSIFGPYPILTPDADGNDVPVVTTSGSYRYVGRLIVEFDSAGVVTSIDEISGLVRVAGGENADAVESDPEVQTQVVEPVATSVAGLAGNVIGTSEVTLDGVRGNVRTQETNEGNLIADALLFTGQSLAADFGVPTPNVALQNGGGIRNDSEIPAGDITELQTFDILPFSNFVSVIPDIPASQFKEILENAVSRVETVSGRFAQIAGFNFVYDPAGTAQVLDGDGNVTTVGSRVVDVTLDDGAKIVDNGALVAGAGPVHIATIDFLARGGDQYPYRGAPFTSVGVTYQQSLANYIQQLPGATITAADYPEGGEGRTTTGAVSTTFSLTVLHNNDGESQLIDAGTGLEDFGGIARFKTLVDNLRAEAAGSASEAVMFSSGDNYLAGAEFNASLGLPAGEPFFDAIGVDLIGYDALALGNHEFDFGPDILEQFILGVTPSEPPFLSSNLDFSAEPGLQALVDAGRIAGSTVVAVDGQQIGVVGATVPELRSISSPRDVIVGQDVAGAVQAEVDALTAAGINKIILISHLQSIAADQVLAAQLSGVDIMVAGGGDELLANPGDLLIPGDEGSIFGPYPILTPDADGNDVPVVTTSGSYRYVGRLIVEFDSAGVVTSIDEISGLVRVAGGENEDAVESDPEVQTRVVDPVMASVAGLEANVIGTSEVVLDGVRGDVRTRETNEGNLIADALLSQARDLAASFGVPAPNVALQNGGGIRNDSEIPAGDITELQTFDMLPFSNFVTVIPDIPASQFKEILENAVSRVETVSGRFAQIAGFSFVYDPAGTAQILDGDANVTTAGSRVLDVTLDDGTKVVEAGEVVTGAAAVHIATIDFLARGGDQYPYRGAPFTALGVTYQRALANFITDDLGGVITAAAYPEGGEGRIRTGELATITVKETTTFADNGKADFRDVTSDAYLDSRKRGFNTGATKLLRVGNKTRPNRTVIRFDFLDQLAGTGVTEPSQLIDAYVELYIARSSGVASGLDVDIVRLTRDWAEGTSDYDPAADGEVTWNSAKHNEDPWATAGAGKVDADRVRKPADTQTLSATGVRVRWNVRSSIKAMLEAGENFGWILRAQDETVLKRFRIVSSEHSRTGRRPKLVITANAAKTILAKATFTDARKGGESDETIIASKEQVVTEFTLAQNYPNPFNPSTTIRYELPEASHVKLAIYDILGREIATLVNQRQRTGVHTLSFDASRLATGVYFYRIEAGSFTRIRKMLLTK